METGLGLLDGALTRERLGQVLHRFHGFWAAAELVVDAWAVTHPQTAVELDWSRRRRVPGLEADLRILGYGGAASAVGAPGFGSGAADTAQVLGWLYVAEGSTLGGAVIERHLARHSAGEPAGRPGVVGAPLHFFVPYPEGPGPMWRSFLEYLDAWTGIDEARVARVEDAAARAFDALATWLAPVMLEQAA